MKPKKITLKDIAKQLGVSISTVSRALRGMPEINPETREAVLKLSRNIDYKLPSEQNEEESGTISVVALILPYINEHYIRLIDGMNDAALNSGLSLTVCLSGDYYGREVALINKLLKVKVNGFLIVKAAETVFFEHYNKIILENRPLAFIERDCNEVNATKIMVDFHAGGYKTIMHLAEKGYKKICFLGARPYSSSKLTIERGILSALKELGLDKYEKKLIFGDFDQRSAFQKTAEILKEADKPDAFFAVNDQVALGIMQAVLEFGYNIPKDIGLIGFYDSIICPQLNPTLSSVSINAYELGKLAINTIADQIHLSSVPNLTPQIFTPQLEIRQSSSPQRRFFGI